MKNEKKKIALALWLGVSVVCGTQVAWASSWFKFAEGETTGYWDDAARWSGSGGDCYCTQHGTIYMTNAVGYVYQFQMQTTKALGGLNLIVTETGSFTSGLYAGADADSWSYVQFDPGAGYSSGGQIGVKGYGVVTNYSQKFQFSESATIGVSAGSYGELAIADGAAFSCGNANKTLVVGSAGTGVVVSLNKNYKTSWVNGTSRLVLGAKTTGHGSLVIEDGARFRGNYLDIGGRATDAGGYGELVLRGGTYANGVDNGNHNILFSLGVSTNETGEISGATYGVIRGWGEFDGDDGNGPSGPYSENRRNDRSVYAQMGRGEIIGDGDGDESHVLDLRKGLCQVTNVLFGVQTTSGWRARNKGAVRLSQPYVGNYDVYSHERCLGCSSGLATPDLVNAVRLSCTKMANDKNKYFGMMVVAPDRTDAYTNALPTGCQVLSVHKLGIFTAVNENTPVGFTGKSTVKIRYDQTKLSGRADTRLELWRYTEASGKWTRLTRLEPGERPSDLCISGEYTGYAPDETFSCGTFAVVERETKGLLLILR